MNSGMIVDTCSVDFVCNFGSSLQRKVLRRVVVVADRLVVGTVIATDVGTLVATVAGTLVATVAGRPNRTLDNSHN